MPNASLLNPGIYDRMLIALIAAVTPAWPILLNDVLWLCGIVSTLYLIGLCIVAMGGMLDAIPQMCVGVAKFMGLVWVLTNFRSLGMMMINVHAGIGLVVSGSTMTAAEFALPGRILWQGQDMIKPLLNYIDQLSWLGYALNFGKIQIMTIAMWVSWIGFALFALNMMWAQVRCFMALLLNFLKVPFLLFHGTAFLAREGLESILGQLMALSTVSLMVGISTPWFQWLAFPVGRSPEYWDAFAFMGGVWFMLVIAFAGPKALQTHGASLLSAVAGTAYGVVRGVSWLRW